MLSSILVVISLDACEKDPTLFSIIQRNYQLAVESLLSQNALTNYPHITSRALEVFSNTYAGSGFVCRFLHCAFSSDGFESSAKRDDHEVQHQRRYRCGHSSCVLFTSGFVSQNLLRKHNEKYHSVVSEGLSLADSLREHRDPATPVKRQPHLKKLKFRSKIAMA
jgi:hypothetical protein